MSSEFSQNAFNGSFIGGAFGLATGSLAVGLASGGIALGAGMALDTVQKVGNSLGGSSPQPPAP